MKIAKENQKLLDEKLKSGEVSGFYFLYGEEQYMKDYYLKKLKSVCIGHDVVKKDNTFNANEDFDVVRFTESNFSPKALYESVISYPVNLKYKFIEVRNVNQYRLTTSEKKMLSEIFTEEDCMCCVVFTQGKNANPKDTSSESDKTGIVSDRGKSENITNLILKNSVCVEFKINSPSTLIKWLQKIFTASKIEISPENAKYMLSFGTNEMYRLQSEAEKLINYKLYKKEYSIKKEDIDLIVSKTTEVEAFEFANSILESNFDKSLRILNKLEILKEEPIFILSQLGKVFYDLKIIQSVKDQCLSDARLISKQLNVHEYKVKLYLAALSKKRNPDEFLNKALRMVSKCDLMSKSVYTDGYIPLYNLIYNLWVI